jgi:hypothetical protein
LYIVIKEYNQWLYPTISERYSIWLYSNVGGYASWMMRIIKFLNYFNLIVAIILLWTYLRSFPLYYDYFLIVGLALTIWYNWWTLKRMMGQKSTFGNLNYVIGILTILFGALLTVGSIAMIKEGFENEKMHLAMGLLYIPLGLTTILFSWTTLKYHRVV